MKIFTKAFWEDALERVGSTFTQGLVAAMIVGGGFGMLDEWSFWEPVLWITALALAKSLAAGFFNPNTGASLFGTTNPAGIVRALITQKDITTDGDKNGMGMPDEIIAQTGDTVAGKGATQQTDTPVDVTRSGPSPY